MMCENTYHPRVFLSYSRTNEKHIQEIREFVSTLRKNGIDADMDELGLDYGDDLYYFMENNINKSDKILLILDKEFVEKADNRQSGVGTVEEFKTNVISTCDSLLWRSRIKFNNTLMNYVHPIEDYINLNQICCEN